MNVTTEFPTLYKKTSTGKLQRWDIWVIDDTIKTAYGQVGGATQTTEDVIREGKNLGRANATTVQEQAISEAQARWEKKVKSGYTPNSEKASAGKDDVEGGLLPMLAHKYRDHAAKIDFPAFAQPKLDGSRCIAIVEDGRCTLWTRTRKPITGMPHIQRAVEALVPRGRAYLDGELYNHTFKDRFEELMHFIRSSTPQPGSEVVEYHVYDVAEGGDFEHRAGRLALLFHNAPTAGPLVRVETQVVATPEELTEFFAACRSAGYEGAMVRNARGLYTGKRSYDLQKVKEFEDAEFEVIGVEEGRGKLTGHVGAFICRTKDGQTFNCKMSGDTEALRVYWKDASKWQGKMLTVKYQGLTGYGVPRFPVGLRFL